MRLHPIRLFATVCAVLLVGGAAARYSGPAAVDDARMLGSDSEPQNWLLNGGNLDGHHFSKLTQINTSTVKDLKPAWTFQYDTYRGQEAEPLVIDGVMYVSTAWSKVYALDAATGRQIWFFDPKVPGQTGVDVCCDTDNRGVAVYKGKVYVGTLDGRLIAIDARTGREAWSTQTTPKNGMPYTITGYPRVIHDKVIIGNAGGDLGVRAFVSGYDAATGKQAWKFYLAPGDPKTPDNAASDNIMESLVRPTWSGEQYYQSGGGGTAWSAIGYDAELNQLYVGTGNGSPWNIRYRSEGKGDNLFLASVVAINPDTGKYVWHYQENPGEAWDYNSTAPFIMADLTIDGRPRKALMHTPKNGFFYVLDRVTGKLISAESYVPVTWTTGIDKVTGRPKDAPNNRYTEGPFLLKPNGFGAHTWHTMAFDPKAGLVFMHAYESGSYVRHNPDFKPIRGGPFNTGLSQSLDTGPLSRPELGAKTLLAWDPVRQKEVWRVSHPRAGVLATAGGLVFAGEGETTGALIAYDSATGKKLWSHPTPNGIQAGAISYAVKGEQYIAVTAGNGWRPTEGDAAARARQNGRMIVFKLNGKGKMPKPPGPPPPANPASGSFTTAQIAAGQASYGVFCGRCHGGNAVNLNVVPDLRRSGALPSREVWSAVVSGGALVHNGMVSWKDHLNPDQVEAIRAFVSAEAVKLKAREQGGVAAR